MKRIIAMLMVLSLLLCGCDTAEQPEKADGVTFTDDLGRTVTVREPKRVAALLGEMLHALGCVNIADANDALLENLSMEYILQQDPDYIFIVQRGDDTEGMRQFVADNLESDPAWSRLKAVQEGKVFFMDKNLYNLKPNNRWGEAYEKLEEILENG